MGLKHALPVILLSLCSVFLTSACSRNQTTVTAEPDTPLTVEGFQVQAENVERRVELVGTLEGNQEVTVSSEVASTVQAIRADLGDLVRQGQVLVELDPKEYVLAVERQQAALAQVLAQLGASGQGESLPAPEQTSTVRRAAADLSEAKTNFERTKTLVEKGVLSQSLYDSAEARYRVTEANYASALEQVRNLQAQVASLRVQLALAQKKVEDCSIRAPFSGAVRGRQVEIGQYLKEQAPVMSLASASPLKLRASVPEKWFPYVESGAPVSLMVEAYSEPFAGRVARVGRAVDPQNRTFLIEAQVDNAQQKLRPGLFARALLTTTRVDSVVKIPAKAVVSFYGVQKVFSIEDGVVHENIVKLGDRTGDFIEVTEGLTAGAWIATTQLAAIRQGSHVLMRKGA